MMIIRTLKLLAVVIVLLITLPLCFVYMLYVLIACLNPNSRNWYQNSK